ncbi:MAG: hypothetical protein MSR67_06850 [Oscillospiraceae bacterium]|nr:hypothetical protein [Oscillospiraceae bacterium]
MKNKKTNIKIKRSKINLYSKRKNKRKKVLTIVITVVAACALGVLGFGLGKPLVEFFNNRNNSSLTSESAWTPPSSEEVSSESEAPVSSEESSEAPIEPVRKMTDVYFLPEDAALSSASLNSALAAAKAAGAGTVAVTLKNETGNFLYKSEIKSLENNDVITGTLSAEQICKAISDAGFIPAAKISTLKDKLCGSRYVTDGGYRITGSGLTWHDNRVDKGGKPWLSPFRTQTLQFMGEITEELSAAGFKNIIAVNTMFPLFHRDDIVNYLSDLPLSDNKARLDALWDVLDSAKAGAEKNGAEIWVELAGENVIAQNRLCTDAELCGSAEKLSEIKLIIDYTPTASATEAYTNAKDFAGKLKTALGDAEFYVVIKGGYSETALSDIKKAFSETEISVFGQ